jgi:hypothetical protein
MSWALHCYVFVSFCFLLQTHIKWHLPGWVWALLSIQQNAIAQAGSCCLPITQAWVQSIIRSWCCRPIWGYSAKGSVSPQSCNLKENLLLTLLKLFGNICACHFYCQYEVYEKVLGLGQKRIFFFIYLFYCKFTIYSIVYNRSYK